MNTEKFALEDCKVMSQKHPATFEVPDATSLRLLQPGDMVKLIFLCPDKSHPDERMWVEITKRADDKFVGKLANDPAFFPEDVLKHEDPVEFEARHVATVYWDK